MRLINDSWGEFQEGLTHTGKVWGYSLYFMHMPHMHLTFFGFEAVVGMMQKVTFLALVAILTCLSNGTVGGKEFPEVWKRYIQTLCHRFDQPGVLMPRVVSAVPDYDGGLLAVTEPLLYLMPPVLMWSPMEQYSDLFLNGVKCSEWSEVS